MPRHPGVVPCVLLKMESVQLVQTRKCWRRNGYKYSPSFSTSFFLLTTFIICLCGFAEAEKFTSEVSNVPKQKTVLVEQPTDSLQNALSLATSSLSKSITMDTLNLLTRIKNTVAEWGRESATSRTFFIFPFIATMAPMFLAQMSGVAISIIPVTGLLLIPALLLPLGLTLAVYWI
ncbi:hypothetical protein Ocin01_16449 [Orchesella cincta]|uniref:Uncharacterized protein n=1 Tax=Orchesella cincta TaxID=48709 RepID=A0A1D2MBG8_ORCCI|nr:hypothetical protein Ocin01_16449 [Orchesella cincta]